MTQCTEMIGELVIIATCRTLRRIIEIVVDDAVIRYGDDCEEQCPIRLKFTKIDEDVEHYDCLININEIFCDGGRPTRRLHQLRHPTDSQQRYSQTKCIPTKLTKSL